MYDSNVSGSLKLNQIVSRAVIFGGSGFIGHHLANKLLQLGIKVTIADIQKPKSLDVDFVYCDVRNPIELGIPYDIDFVYNLAAVHRTPGHESNEYYETNLSGAINVTEYCRRKNIKFIFFSSSIAVYGDAENEYSETSTTSPVSHYGRSKRLAEIIHSNWVNGSEDRKLVICRPAVIYGIGENGNFTRMARAMRNGFFIIPGSRQVIKSCGYVEDLIDSIVFIQGLDESLIYNFAFPEKYTIQDIVSDISEISGYRMPINLPVGSLAKFLKPMGKVSMEFATRVEKLIKSLYVAPNVLIRKGFVWKHDLRTSLEVWHALSQFDFSQDTKMK